MQHRDKRFVQTVQYTILYIVKTLKHFAEVWSDVKEIGFMQSHEIVIYSITQ